MTPPLRFLCDEMLARLGRWLRAAGYDTAIAAGGAPDGAVLDQALREGRLLLTRDRGLSERRLAAGTVIEIAGSRIGDQARDLMAKLPVDWLAAPFTRCLVCNVPLEPASEAERLSVPETVRPDDRPIHTCPSCRRLYWAGGHEKRMRSTLEGFRRAGP
ncbi:MAG TPA: DUF5615 family PIN-like protein [Alphaproteobacteria bacterium]|nr:DUF5615 family PIN-like protein [Alphaproteobacteria bacterium]